jgi:hypothetical protein
MHRAWIVAGALGVLLIGFAGSQRPVAADHCFGVFVEPSSGPPGTVFVIRQGGGDPGVVTLFHDGSRVARYRLDGWRDAIRFHSSPADVGRWRVHLEIPHGDEPCVPDDSFTVTAAPDTATEAADAGRAGLAPDAGGGTASLLLLAFVAVAGALITTRRLSARPG